MKKLFTLVAVALMAVSASAQQTVWNFSDWTAQTFTSEYTQDGLTVAATADQSVTIDGNKKTITGANNTYECTQRLKFGGAGGSGADGESAYITIYENTTGMMRNTSLTVSHENGSYGPTISLMQLAASGGATYAYVTDQTGTPVADNSTINLESSATSLTYNVESDGGLEAKFTGTEDEWYCEWLFAGIKDGVLSINVQQNESSEPRSVTMIITATGSKDSLVTLTFTQAGA